MPLGCSLHGLRHSERVRSKAAVPQEPRGIRGQLLGGSCDDHQAVTGVTKAPPVEARIAGGKCDLARTARLRQDLSVGHSRAAPIYPYLADGQMPRFEKLPLAVQRVLVEQNQPALRCLPGLNTQRRAPRSSPAPALRPRRWPRGELLPPPPPPQGRPTASRAPPAPERPKRRSCSPKR